MVVIFTKFKKTTKLLPIILFISLIASILFVKVSLGAAWDNNYSISGRNYYYDGYFYMWSTEEYGDTYEESNYGNTYHFSDPTPFNPSGLYSSDPNNAEMDPYIGEAANYGFTSYADVWAGPKQRPSAFIHDTYGVIWEKLAHAYYVRPMTDPYVSGYSITGARYVNGSDYWVKTGDALLVKSQSSQDFQGTLVGLRDYVNVNYLRLSSGTYTDEVSDTRGANSIANVSLSGENNFWLGAYSLGSKKGDTDRTFLSDIYVQPNVDKRNLSVIVGGISANGGGTGWQDTNLNIRTDNDAPTATSVSVKNITATGYDVYVYGVMDNGGSGVNTVLFPTWTTANGQDDIIWGQGQNLGNGTWYYHVDISDHNNEYGAYNTDVYTKDNVGNMGSVGSNRGIIIGLPNLSIVSVVYPSGSHFYKGTPYTLGWTVTNNGYINVGSFVVQVKINGVSLGQQTISDLAAGAKINVYYNWTPTSIGSLPVMFQVDVNNQVAESNETDNTWSGSYVVYYPNVSVIGLVAPDPFKSGQVITLTANTGGYATSVSATLPNGAVLPMTPSSPTSYLNNTWKAIYPTDPVSTPYGPYPVVFKAVNSISTGSYTYTATVTTSVLKNMKVNITH